MNISVLNIVRDTTVDGPGFRTTVYCAGCTHNCPGCHNPESHDIRAGRLVDTEVLAQEILKDDFANVTFSGGDPMQQAVEFAELAMTIKQCSDKTIWCYTGYTFEYLLHSFSACLLLCWIDVLVDGPFVQHLRDESLRFRGSSNQRIIDVQRSLREKRVVEIEKYYKGFGL